MLPLVLASIVTGVLISLLGRAGPRQIAALLGAAAAAGLVAIGIVQGWLGILEGDWWVNAGVLSLTMVAVASVLAGLNGLIGHAGLGLGALLMILVGNPWSGISSAPELLPTGVGATGQLLPPGAGGNLLRSTAFFDGTGAARHLTVLLVWTALGLAMMGAAAVLRGSNPDWDPTSHSWGADRGIHAALTESQSGSGSPPLTNPGRKPPARGIDIPAGGVSTPPGDFGDPEPDHVAPDDGPHRNALPRALGGRRGAGARRHRVRAAVDRAGLRRRRGAGSPWIAPAR